MICQSIAIGTADCSSLSNLNTAVTSTSRYTGHRSYNTVPNTAINNQPPWHLAVCIVQNTKHSSKINSPIIDYNQLCGRWTHIQHTVCSTKRGRFVLWTSRDTHALSLGYDISPALSDLIIGVITRYVIRYLQYRTSCTYKIMVLHSFRRTIHSPIKASQESSISRGHINFTSRSDTNHFIYLPYLALYHD